MSSDYEQYKASLEGRREDSSRYWTVFGVMAAVNGAMLTFINSTEPTVPTLYMAVFGILISLVWLGPQLRLSAWVKWCEKKLIVLEVNMPELERLFTNRQLDSKNPFRVGFSTRIGGVILPSLFTVAWFVVAIRYR